MELADQQVSENDGGLTGAEIPLAADVPAKEAPAEKLTLRQEIEKNVETVRTEEAKRARAADGKFTKLDGAVEKPATDEIPKPEAQPAASSADGPPPIWKGIWESMTPEARALAVKREAEVAKGFEEYRGKTAQLQEITQALDPIRSVLQQNGITSDAHAVKTLLEWEGSFRNPQTRVQAFHNLARQYGVDLSTLVPSSQSGSPSTAQDIPDPIRPVIDQFGNRLESAEARIQTWEQNQTAKEVAAFAKDKPHFEKVRGRMASLMIPAIDSRGQVIAPAAAQNLDEAYQQAIWMDPEIRQQMLDEQANTKATELAKAQAEKVRRAQAANVSPSGRPPSGPAGGVPQKQASVRETILNSVNALREEQRA